jgi:hypothetical protein
MSRNTPGVPILTLRDLSRATLARQMLLAREDVEVVTAIERVFGLQAQVPRPPFVGLWTRLKRFRREALLRALVEREVVRATMMRGTLHLMSTSDFRRFRPTLQPMLDGALVYMKDHLHELQMEPTLLAARELLEERPRPFDEIRPALVERGLPGNERAMGLAVRMLLPLVQLPSAEATWGFDTKAPFGLAESWIGDVSGEAAELTELVRRYLAAFGPASVSDAAAWSGFKGLRPAFETIRGELLVFRDEAGRELFDLPDAPRPPGDTPAPVRFLPDFDNLVLAHDDRSRVVPPEHRKRIVTKNLLVAATFLLDGFVAGTWKVEVKRRVATLVLTPFGPLVNRDVASLEKEGLALLRFLEEDAADYAVRIT